MKYYIKYRINVFLALLTLTWAESVIGQDKQPIKSLRLSHTHVSKISKITHSYFQQQHKGIDIYNAVFSTHRDSLGNIVQTTSSFIQDAGLKINTDTPKLSVKEAIDRCRLHIIEGISTENNAKMIKDSQGLNLNQVWMCPSLSAEEINIKLIYQPINDQAIRLCWELSFTSLDSQHWWNIRLDAETGAVLDQNDWSSNCGFVHCEGHEQLIQPFMPREFKNTIMMTPEYAALPIPVESPSHGPRDTMLDPSDVIASPFGWHDDNGIPGAEYTTTKGNNVEAKEDLGGDNEASGGVFADGGTNADFRFPHNLTQPPTSFQNATLTNLFYWNNLMHDVWYRHGFDEDAGNFQTNNYGNGGIANDAVRADGMDGIGRNNANFSTPPDGSKPRMQMYLWDQPGTTNTFALTSPNTNSYPATRATFGALNYNIVNTQLVIASPVNACSSLTNASAVAGKIAIIDRSSSCNYGVQALNAQTAGAIAVIICNNTTGTFAANGGANTLSVTIPIVMISQSNCATIKTLISSNSVFANLSATVPIQRDSDFDNGVIAHEYGHGVSNRLTGGAGNSNCLSNQEQMGEGWSDWFGLMMTMKSTDTGATARGIGTFVLGQPTTGQGIRPYRYTTDMGANPHTYNSIKTAVIPHGVGSVWCAMLWEMTWKLIDMHGFDPDFYNGDGGNNIAMKLVIEGMKLQPCSPGFVDGRDAILLADRLMYNGQHQCLIWESFAKRGLGYNATQGLTNNRADGVEDFAFHPSCLLTPTITADKPVVIEKDFLTYRLSVKNISTSTLTNVVLTDTLPPQTEFISATNGGTFNGVSVVYPTVSIPVGDSIVRFFTVKVSKTAAGGTQTMNDGAEQELTTYWRAISSIPATGAWTRSTTSPRTGAQSYFAVDYNSANEMFLVLDPIKKLKPGCQLTFWHNYNVEPTWDGGRVQISNNNGLTWQDLGSRMTQNGYNSYVDNDPTSLAFSGNSNGYIQTIINLADFAGQNISVRFWMHCDVEVGGVGWRLDDIQLHQVQTTINNRGNVSSTQSLAYRFDMVNPTELNNCIVVSNNQDIGEGSLRFAFDCSSATDTIFFAQNMSGSEIQLNNSLVLDKNVKMMHVFSPQVRIKNTGSGPTIIVNNGINVTLDNLSIVGSNSATVPRAIVNNGHLECTSITVIDALLDINTGQTIINNGLLLLQGYNILKK